MAGVTPIIAHGLTRVRIRMHLFWYPDTARFCRATMRGREKSFSPPRTVRARFGVLLTTMAPATVSTARPSRKFPETENGRCFPAIGGTLGPDTAFGCTSRIDTFLVDL